MEPHFMSLSQFARMLWDFLVEQQNLKDLSLPKDLVYEL